MNKQDRAKGGLPQSPLVPAGCCFDEACDALEIERTAGLEQRARARYALRPAWPLATCHVASVERAKGGAH